VTTLELDVVVTADRVPVVSHNPRLEPFVVRDASGAWLPGTGPAIGTLSLPALRRYDVGRLDPSSAYAQGFPEQRPADGERIPTLAEVMRLAAGASRSVRLNVETKLTPDDAIDPAVFARLVLDVARSEGMLHRLTLQSFDWRTLREAKRIEPSVGTSCLTIESDTMNTVADDAAGASRWLGGLVLRDYAGSVPALVKAAGCSTWSMFSRNLTPALVREAHGAGLSVLPWTVNDPGEMRRLLDMNVDGIITDYPDRLRRVMAERGMPLP